MSEELTISSCPHCGNTDTEYFHGWDDERDIGREPVITCGGCGVGFSVGFFGCGISDDEAEAITIEAYNRRAK